jgi:spore coat protein U-like protein
MLAILAMPHAAHAELAATANLEVNAMIVRGCWINNVSTGGPAGVIASLDFGSHPQTKTGSLTAYTVEAQSFTMRCTPGTALRTQVDRGQNDYSGFRRMRLGSTNNYISYKLCSDAPCLVLITIPYDVSRVLDLTGPQSININYFASVTLSGTLPPGTYRDQVTISYIW